MLGNLMRRADKKLMLKLTGEILDAMEAIAVIKDVMLVGIIDSDIRRETLSTDGIPCKTTNEITSTLIGKWW